jgi:hypothetical protein
VVVICRSCPAPRCRHSCRSTRQRRSTGVWGLWGSIHLDRYSILVSIVPHLVARDKAYPLAVLALGDLHAGRSAGPEWAADGWRRPVGQLPDETSVRKRQRTIPALKCYQCGVFRSQTLLGTPLGASGFLSLRGFDSCRTNDNHRRRSVETTRSNFSSSMQSPGPNLRSTSA